MKSYELLTIIGDIDDRYILEAQKPTARRGRRMAPKRLLLAAALLILTAAVAGAAVKPRLLSWMFRASDGEPSRAAVEHLMTPEPSDAPGTASLCDFRVDEYLLDGDTLYLSYTLRNPTEETLIYRLGLSVDGHSIFGFDNMEIPLGGEIDGTALPAMVQKQGKFDLEADAGTALEAELTIYAQRSVAPFIDFYGSSPVGTPVIVFNRRFQAVADYAYGWTYAPDEGGGWSGDGESGTGRSGSATPNHDDLEAMREAIFAAEDPSLARAQALEELGYVEIAERRVVPLRFENGVERSLTASGERFDAGIGEVELVSLSRQAVRTTLALKLTPTPDWLAYWRAQRLEARVYVNGGESPVESYTIGNEEDDGSGSFLPEPVGILDFEVSWPTQDEPAKSLRIQFMDADGEPIGKEMEWRIN